MECIGYFIFSFLLVALLIPVVIRLSSLLSLYDQADVYRKKHNGEISRLGGVAIFIGLMSSILLFLDWGGLDLAFTFASCILLFTLGLNDDICGVSPFLKFIVQLISALVLLLYGEYEDIGWIPFLSVFLFVLLSNAFNLIDGLDGLAGTIGVFVNLCFGVVLFLGGDRGMAAIAFALSGSLTGFLFYNYPPAKIFMGDSMAMVTGLISGVMSLRVIKVLNTGEISFLYSGSSAAIVFVVLMVPVFDCLRVFLIRILHGKSPFEGDRGHIHHRLKLLGCTDRQVVVGLLFFKIGTLGLTLLLQHLGSFTLISLQLFIAGLINGLITFVIRKTADKNYRLRDVLLKDTLNIRGS
ncbi:glycosyltransferase family 4 protein [Pedobacter steynii]|uniref:glycosyltransferase family 4 protein n=1 Tax=Pedobacter steynii TaxID=430522 RepID=UPI0009F6BE01|nr:MraY family glycosyltransferase [Pedobacter steynii]